MRILLIATKDRLHVVAVWIEYERSVVMWPPLAGCPIVGSTCFLRSGMEGIHLPLFLATNAVCWRTERGWKRSIQKTGYSTP